MEELVAELGAAFLAADLGIEPEVQPNHASYIESWLKVLKGDKRAIFSAASMASKAVEFLHGLQPQSETSTEPEQPEPDDWLSSVKATALSLGSKSV